MTPRRLTSRVFRALLFLVGFFHWCYLVHAQSKSSQNLSHEDTAQRQEVLVHHQDMIEDSLYDPLAADPSCSTEEGQGADCYSPPESSIETETLLDATCLKGGEDYSELEGDTTSDRVVSEDQCSTEERVVDKHWGSDPTLLAMRDQLRLQAIEQPLNDRRPPIFLLPGLASTRLVAWKLKRCTGMFSTDIRVQDNVWLNINLVIQMGTVNVECMTECLRLGLNQSDTDDWNVGCKLRPDEGLDAIASLAPGGIGSSLLVGGTNTVYSWLIQWLSENLGYDVTNMVGLPYDWRLSPDKMEARDGFLSMMRRRIEASVASNGGLPGIAVAHSMGNLVFRYFLDWLRVQMREEAYNEYIARAKRREQRRKKAESEQNTRQQKELERLEQQRQNFQEMEGRKEEVQESRASLPVPETDPEPEDLASIIPGWMAASIPGLENVLGWFSTMGQDEQIDPGTKETPEETATPKGTNDRVSPDVSNINKSDDEESMAGKSAMDEESEERDVQLRELAKEEGDANWREWIEKHIWTYIGLSAPLLGAVNPLRAVLSGENMGLPITDDVARYMEITFGSTHTINPVSIATGFCDQWDFDDWGSEDTTMTSSSKDRLANQENDKRLACLDDIANDIEFSSPFRDPWKNFPALKALLRDRIDWDTTKPMVDVKVELCDKPSGDSGNDKKKKNCIEKETLKFGPKDVENGRIFDEFHSLWPEDGAPLIVKREQLEESFINTKVANILDRTWERPPIKHVVFSYGVDVPTEVGYIYKKQIHNDETTRGTNITSGLPDLKAVLWEEPKGKITVEPLDSARGSIADHFIKKKSKKIPFHAPDDTKGLLKHSGDGSVPYLSLSWVHTWLLHAARARRFGEEYGNQPRTDRKNVLDHISISHRPQGTTDWVDGPPLEEAEILDPSKLVDKGDTGTDHPHGTRYKPLMTRYHNVGISRTTGVEYTTTVIEAIGVEHKETTRNYDILAAVFSDALVFMHDDFGLVGNDTEA